MHVRHVVSFVEIILFFMHAVKIPCFHSIIYMLCMFIWQCRKTVASLHVYKWSIMIHSVFFCGSTTICKVSSTSSLIIIWFNPDDPSTVLSSSRARTFSHLHTKPVQAYTKIHTHIPFPVFFSQLHFVTALLVQRLLLTSILTFYSFVCKIHERSTNN